MTNRLCDGAKSVRFNENVVTGHAIDQYLKRALYLPTGRDRDFHKQIARVIAQAVRQARYVGDCSDGKLFVHDGMGYVVMVYPHYRKVITCYRVTK
jgi:hypothetical protein